MANVKLQSSDGEVFEVEADVAKVSVTIKNMLDGEGDELCFNFVSILLA